MAATMAEIRAGIVANLATLDAVQASPYMLGSPTPPALHLIPVSIEYDQAMHRGLDIVVFTAQVFVAFGLDQAAQITLDEFMLGNGTRSLKSALESDRTLGGIVNDVRVTGLTSYDVIALPDKPQMLAASFRVEVYV